MTSEEPKYAYVARGTLNSQNIFHTLKCTQSLTNAYLIVFPAEQLSCYSDTTSNLEVSSQNQPTTPNVTTLSTYTITLCY